MGEPWHTARISISSEDADLASGLLCEAGCSGIVEESSADGKSVTLSASFNAENEDAAALRARLESLLSSRRSLAGTKPDISTSAEDGWRESWRQWFKPFSIVPGIVIAPGWENYKPLKEESVITMDPGMAFGTGLHQTTRLCAAALFQAMGKGASGTRGTKDAYPSVLDVGTGSGVLAILAAKLGAARIAAVENDPDALSVARENFAANGTNEIELSPSVHGISGEFDIVVANILLGTLVELAKELSNRTAPGGTLILSGITSDQEAELAGAFSPDMRLLESEHGEEWSCLTFLCRRKEG